MDNKYLPGRLGDAQATLIDDPRADPRIVAALKALPALDAGLEPVDASSSYDECLAYCAAMEAAAAAAHPMMEDAIPDFPNVASQTEVIKGADDNDITLYIDTPTDAHVPAPCIVHTHGGGMVLMTAADPMFVRWRKSLAAAGMIVVGVEFRNGGGKLGNHPYPAGLNDCASGLHWTHERRAELGISAIVISGESGGGNLCIATTMKATREGWGEAVDGVYALCPYISGQYGNPPPELLSLIENDTYTLNCAQMAGLVKLYDPTGEHSNNPLAWPLQATPADLAGLPPHYVSVNELDPLRDEGLHFARKLRAAGISAVTRTVHGTNHAGDLGTPDLTPDLYADTLRSVTGFAASLAK